MSRVIVDIAIRHSGHIVPFRVRETDLIEVREEERYDNVILELRKSHPRTRMPRNTWDNVSITYNGKRDELYIPQPTKPKGTFLSSARSGRYREGSQSLGFV